MSLVKKLGRAITSFALIGSMFLGGCDYFIPAPNPKTEIIDAFPSQRIGAMRKELSGKKLALALITNYDPENATEGMEEMFREDFSDLPDYILYTARTEKLEDVFNNLRDYSTLKRIDALILAYHGFPDKINVNNDQEINLSNVRRLFKDYSSIFSDDAVILLYSCSTGKEHINIAIRLADVLDSNVIAPKFKLVPETYLAQDKRVGEFAPDENGRLSFDYGNFRKYDKIDTKNKKYINCLATISYERFNGEEVNGHNGKNYFLFVER